MELFVTYMKTGYLIDHNTYSKLSDFVVENKENNTFFC